MILICNQNMPDLTKDEEYIRLESEVVIGSFGSRFIAHRIKGDSGKEVWYSESVFKSLSDLRELQLSKIL
jgi:hypothetical protein